jgi:alcohol dehydrogenase class IV
MSEIGGVPAFSNHLPVRISFGDGVAGQLHSVVKSHGARRVLVMIDAGLAEHSAGVAGAIGTLLARLDFPVLASLGVGEEHLDELTRIALEDFFITQSPCRGVRRRYGVPS